MDIAPEVRCDWEDLGPVKPDCHSVIRCKICGCKAAPAEGLAYQNVCPEKDRRKVVRRAEDREFRD